ncbi:MAG: hypothetical protein F6K35_19075, partial [Okeania sp. SIO2H7]|nr:hypothetical protein [Okeania sp. SIO2H7]
MIFGKEIEKLDASIEEIEKALDVFSSEICLGVTSIKQDIGNSVEFIFDGEIVEGVVQRLVSVKRSLVKTSTGLFLVSNNKFLQPVDNDFFQCKNNGEINLAQIKAEFAQAELEEVEAES